MLNIINFLLILFGFVDLRAQEFKYVTVVDGVVVAKSSASAVRVVYELPGTKFNVGDLFDSPVSSSTIEQSDGTRAIKEELR